MTCFQTTLARGSIQKFSPNALRVDFVANPTFSGELETEAKKLKSN